MISHFSQTICKSLLIMKRLLLAVASLSTLLVVPSAQSLVLSGRDKVDLITVSAYLIDETLHVSLTYKNKDRDLYVDWSDGSVTVRYKVYTLRGSIFKPTKGLRIARGIKVLQDSRQKFYVDIPRRFIGKKSFEWAIIECDITCRRLKVKASDTFLLR